MTTTPQPTPRAAGEAVKAFREYLAVHPDACTGMGGHAMDDMALDLARIALDFQVPTPMFIPPAMRRLHALATGTSLINSVHQVIRDYHFALDTRQHGGVAADQALRAIEAALGTRWVQGHELAARATPGAAP